MSHRLCHWPQSRITRHVVAVGGDWRGGSDGYPPVDPALGGVTKGTWGSNSSIIVANSA
jgi:hypothetical protein